MAEGHFQFAEHLFCWCGYPITVEDVMTVEGERQLYSDGETGGLTNECPGCGESPLDVSRLFPSVFGGREEGDENEPLLGGN